MARLDDWQAFLDSITKGVVVQRSSNDAADATTADAFEHRYATYLAEHERLFVHCRRAPHDLTSPAADYARVIDHMTSWIDQCEALAAAAMRSADAGSPMFVARLKLVTADTARTLEIVRQMRGAAAVNAVKIAKSVAEARGDALIAIGRLSDAQSATTKSSDLGDG